MGIIKSLLDTDFYSFTQMQAVLHNYPASWVKYVFKWRNWSDMKLRISVEDFAGRLRKQLDALCELKFTEEELKYLSIMLYLKRDFIEFLRLFKLNRSYIKVRVENGQLKIIIEGPWLHTILFEVPVLAIISELYAENNEQTRQGYITTAREKLDSKLSFVEASLTKDSGFLFADFGTRRRASMMWQDEIVSTILSRPSKNFLIGTSNVMLAMKYGIRPIGTMSHQWLMAHQQLGPRLVDSQSAALQVWANEYRGELGIALSDVIGFDAFLKDFDRYFALLFDGCRHDSGDPASWCTRLIDHYKSLRINPMSKYAVFSDGLNFNKAVELFNQFHNSINVSFGIGTNLTNDCGFVAPQIVIKLVECNGKPVAKVPDSPGKGMCEDEEFSKYLLNVIVNKVK